MIIDDDYSQYEMFRIMNHADDEAKIEFDKIIGTLDGAAKEAELAGWTAKAEAAQKASEEENTEESVYNLAYADYMVKHYKRELGIE